MDKFLYLVLFYVRINVENEVDRMRLNNKGFSLIEILSVILILSIILAIAIPDTTYNVMYTSGHIYVIDTIEYDYAKVTYLENRESIDELVKMFLVDNYFDYFVRDSKILSEMYDCKGVDSISFIEEFKNELSNYMGMEINTLNKAKSLVKRVNMPSYGRSIIKINY